MIQALIIAALTGLFFLAASWIIFLRQRLRETKRALYFYSDLQAYVTYRNDPKTGLISHVRSRILHDKGRRARAALGE